MRADEIESLIAPRAVLLAADCQSAGEVIAALSARLKESGHVKESHAAATLLREASHPTGLPTEGAFCVAIPHTDPEHVLKPAMAIATLDQPVAFRNMEDPDESLAVRLVLLLAFTDKDKQIDALQLVAGMLQSAPLLEAIVSAQRADEIIDILKAQGEA